MNNIKSFVAFTFFTSPPLNCHAVIVLFVPETKIKSYSAIKIAHRILSFLFTDAFTISSFDSNLCSFLFFRLSPCFGDFAFFNSSGFVILLESLLSPLSIAYCNLLRFIFFSSSSFSSIISALLFNSENSKISTTPWMSLKSIWHFNLLHFLTSKKLIVDFPSWTTPTTLYFSIKNAKVTISLKSLGLIEYCDAE